VFQLGVITSRVADSVSKTINGDLFSLGPITAVITWASRKSQFAANCAHTVTSSLVVSHECSHAVLTVKNGSRGQTLCWTGCKSGGTVPQQWIACATQSSNKVTACVRSMVVDRYRHLQLVHVLGSRSPHPCEVCGRVYPPRMSPGGEVRCHGLPLAAVRGEATVV